MIYFLNYQEKIIRAVSGPNCLGDIL